MENLQYYDLESYLFKMVGPSFAALGDLCAFDFFCIVIWKANRAKSAVARRLLRNYSTLEEAVKALTAGLAQQSTPMERMRYLCNPNTWGFSLPMASAILTVLYPEEFTVYDVRVCDSLKEMGVPEDFHKLANKTDFDHMWTGYERFKAAVECMAPSHLSLRDKDRYLWGRSFFKQLNEDIAAKFAKTADSARVDLK